MKNGGKNKSVAFIILFSVNRDQAKQFKTIICVGCDVRGQQTMDFFVGEITIMDYRDFGQK